jgi:hypothetical protein
VSKINYIRCGESEVHAAVRFHVPAVNQGQIVEVAYGVFGSGDAGPGDPYKRVTDRSVGTGLVEYYRLVEPRK